MLATKTSQDVRELFTELEDPDRLVSVGEFSEMRDFLMLRLLMASGQRCGALANLTVAEYERGQMTGDLFVTQTHHHKTATSKGPAKLFWDAELKRMGDTYKAHMQPLFANAESVSEAKPGLLSEPLFFINCNGNVLSKSR
jgi:integrase